MPWAPTVPAVDEDAGLRGASARALLSNVSSAALVAALHQRRYGWEVLHAAGLDFSSFSEVELVSWLKRNQKGFRGVLGAASLGLGSFSSVELLREVSGRPDLPGALAETGLGAGADFSCAEDESPRDSGCQIKCRGGRACPRAHDMCRRIKHCVKVDVNRGATWATLKSLTVFAPRPVPVCEGYAFDESGATPSPIMVPPTVSFEVDAPREEWCFRDMGGNPLQLLAAALSKGDTGARCSFGRCFDLERCRASAQSRHGPSLYIHPEVPRSKDMARLPGCLSQVHAASLAEGAESACLVFPTVNINCEWDTCDPSTHMQLKNLGSWHGRGRNHLIWDYNDAKNLKFRTDEALYIKTSMSIDDYRPGFDVPFPLLPNGVASHVTPDELRAAEGKRHLLLSFKGTCQSKSHRGKLARLHNGRDVVMACTGGGGGGGRGEQYDYRTLMLTSTFSAAPAGNGLHSYRLAEAIFLGSIPVIIDTKIVLPFCSVLDWREFSVRVTPDELPRLEQKLRAIPPDRIAAMQRRLLEVKQRYLLHPFSTALSLIGLRVRGALGLKLGNATSGR